MKRSKKICTFLLVLTLIVTSLFCFGGCFDKNKDGLDGRDFDLFSTYTQLVERGEFSGTSAIENSIAQSIVFNQYSIKYVVNV